MVYIYSYIYYMPHIFMLVRVKEFFILTSMRRHVETKGTLYTILNQIIGYQIEFMIINK